MAGSRLILGAGGATRGAEDEQAPLRDDDPEVVAQIAHQACAIGVVAEDGVVVLQRQRVDRRGVCGARGELLRHLDRRDFVGHRDVQAAPTAAEEALHPLGELLGRDVVGAVAHRLTGVAGEDAVDEG